MEKNIMLTEDSLSSVEGGLLELEKNCKPNAKLGGFLDDLIVKCYHCGYEFKISDGRRSDLPQFGHLCCPNCHMNDDYSNDICM